MKTEGVESLDVQAIALKMHNTISFSFHNTTDYILVYILQLQRFSSVENYNRCPHKVNQVHFDIDSL